jgi:hypothetical protein
MYEPSGMAWARLPNTARGILTQFF